MAYAFYTLQGKGVQAGRDPHAIDTNSIGDALLMGHWKDPDFDPGERAFYYVRVIEIPTPRWTAYDAKRLGVEMPEEVTMTVTDRAYTSRILYTPWWGVASGQQRWSSQFLVAVGDGVSRRCQ